MASAITWFQIPASDPARAKTFYETICGFELQQMDAGPGMKMWGFHADRRKGEIGGAGFFAMIADSEGNTVGLHSQE